MPPNQLDPNQNQTPVQPQYQAMPPVTPTPQPQIVQPTPKNNKVIFIIIGAGLLLLAIAVAAYFLFFSKKPQINNLAPEAAKFYAPSVLDKVKDIDKWSNGKFVMQGGHGLPEVRGTFAKTNENTIYSFIEVDTQVVSTLSQQMADMPKAVSSSIDDVTTRPKLYNGNEYQLDMLGLLNQIGFGLDPNVIVYFNDLIAETADPAETPELVACKDEQVEYRAKTGRYLTNLKPNYVYDDKFKSHIWRLDTADLYKNLSVKANAPKCYEFLDKFLSSEIESDKSATVQLLFEITEETAEGTTFKIFGGPPAPSEKYDLVFKAILSERNKVEVPITAASNPVSVFSRRNAFAITASQCGRLPLIALAVGNTLNAYVTPEQPLFYKGPQIRDHGYFCTPAEAIEEGLISPN